MKIEYYMVRNLYILLFAVFVLASCDKEDRKNTYADQEARIDSYVASLSTDYEVIYNGETVDPEDYIEPRL